MAHSIQLSLDTEGVPENIQADERMLKQVMYNLLSNAVKFTPDRGQISVTTTEYDKNMKDYQADFQIHGSGVKISVSDSGIGIRPEDLDRIFNPFEQAETSNSRKHQGTGLGLSLCKNFIDLHGGKIWAESQGYGRGSSFHFIIPFLR